MLGLITFSMLKWGGYVGFEEGARPRMGMVEVEKEEESFRKLRNLWSDKIRSSKIAHASRLTHHLRLRGTCQKRSVTEFHSVPVASGRLIPKEHNAPASRTTMSAVKAVKLREKYTHFRILVIGRANAGKTTLLKRVCNTDDDPCIYNKKGENQVRGHHPSPSPWSRLLTRDGKPARTEWRGSYHLIP